MNFYLLEIDTLVYFLKGHDAVVNRFVNTSLPQLFISDTTCAELYYAMYACSLGEKVINGLIGNLNPISFNGYACKRFGQLKADLKDLKHELSDIELINASIAVSKEYTLVTNNTDRYTKIKQLKLENWSKPSYGKVKKY